MKENETRGRKPKNSTDIPSVNGYRRWSVIMNNQYIEKFREISHREHMTMKDVLEAAMKSAIDRYEEKNGEILIDCFNSQDAKNLFE